ncbi:D-glycero-beta-D-manno-heptose-7-phosphate kinase [Oceanibacterium hippocampi]|uniref:Bifunctional protein HldE n=1 Tax=Oceanibacterium hippocampi TaxID=745714 RepID=A0A1Y5RMV5_9PROT|nr:D-glycero-beta-D-manno-heptose-7-phosphate kinase [Oceanibacterium hippocampi]SLN21167.1 Bifunctional protein HldE [Oceanibacterium hippocampi]
MNEFAAFAAFEEAAPGLRVLCLGDVMLDRFVYGRVSRISPEAPIPVVHVQREEAMMGGAGNVARNITALGASATLIAAVGADQAAETLREAARADTRLETRFIVSPKRPTTLKTRFVAGAQQLLRADREEAGAVDEATAGALIEAVRAALPTVQAMVLSDYGKGVLSAPVLAEAIRLGRAAGIPVIADPKGADVERYRGVTLLKPNLKELADFTGAPCGSDAEVADAAEMLRARLNIPALLVTRSGAGMTLVTEGEVRHVATQAREVFDVSGAGDTVAAALAIALAAGVGSPEAAAIANLAGGIAVGKAGTATVGLDELGAAVHAADMHAAEIKIVGLESALERVRKWRAQGLRVGFTNGCFDLVHPGHVSLLGQARAACDRLIVGLNSDQSIARLKGPDRPIQAEAARAIVLASLASVDLVIVFAEDTPIRLIETLKPDVLVKGADYAPDQVVGGDIVRANGGKVMLARLEDGYSTTRTIARMNRQSP